MNVQPWQLPNQSWEQVVMIWAGTSPAQLSLVPWTPNFLTHSWAHVIHALSTYLRCWYFCIILSWTSLLKYNCPTSPPCGDAEQARPSAFHPRFPPRHWINRLLRLVHLWALSTLKWAHRFYNYASVKVIFYIELALMWWHEISTFSCSSKTLWEFSTEPRENASFTSHPCPSCFRVLWTTFTDLFIYLLTTVRIKPGISMWLDKNLTTEFCPKS